MRRTPIHLRTAASPLNQVQAAPVRPSLESAPLALLGRLVLLLGERAGPPS